MPDFLLEDDGEFNGPQYEDIPAELAGALRGAIGALEFSRDYHSDLGNEEQAFCQDRLDAAVTALAKFDGGKQ